MQPVHQRSNSWPEEERKLPGQWSLNENPSPYEWWELKTGSHEIWLRFHKEARELSLVISALERRSVGMNMFVSVDKGTEQTAISQLKEVFLSSSQEKIEALKQDSGPGRPYLLEEVLKILQ